MRKNKQRSRSDTNKEQLYTYISCFLVFAARLNWKWHIEGPLLSLSCLKCILYDPIFHHTRPIFLLRYTPDKSYNLCVTNVPDSCLWLWYVHNTPGYGRLMGIRREKEKKWKSRCVWLRCTCQLGRHTWLYSFKWISYQYTSTSPLKKHRRTVC